MKQNPQPKSHPKRQVWKGVKIIDEYVFSWIKSEIWTNTDI